MTAAVPRRERVACGAVTPAGAKAWTNRTAMAGQFSRLLEGKIAYIRMVQPPVGARLLKNTKPSHERQGIQLSSSLREAPQ